MKVNPERNGEQKSKASPQPRSPESPASELKIDNGVQSTPPRAPKDVILRFSTEQADEFNQKVVYLAKHIGTNNESAALEAVRRRYEQELSKEAEVKVAK